MFEFAWPWLFLLLPLPLFVRYFLPKAQQQASAILLSLQKRCFSSVRDSVTKSDAKILLKSNQQ